ncbi:MAG: hypothetical protein ACREVE_05920 [Gammaproteobacteria bacterium]
MIGVYQASPIKRARASKADIAQRKLALYDIVAEIQPCTVRQCFYQAEVRGVVEKTETGYDKVQRALVEMRRDKTLPYDWIVDNTRWQRRPTTYADPAEAIERVANFYRKDLWWDADNYVEIWLEKDALSGVIWPVTSKFDVPLMVARGFASLSFLHRSADYIAELDVPAYIYHLGDFDPSGVNAAEKIESTLRQLAPDAEIYFERIAVLPEQIAEWDLPTRPTKATDSRAKRFGHAQSVELDAIHPDTLRNLVTEVIERHLPPHQYEILKVAEDSERQFLRQWAKAAQDGQL